MSHPQSYEILLFPEHEESDADAHAPGTAIRSGVVAATGETGASGYPRYAGDGMEADIDPSTHTVEALLVDGWELDYALTVRIAERVGGTERELGDTRPEGEEGERPEDAAAAPPPDDPSGGG
ncbi:hypothetical protein [Streptomyces griseus]|uniref:hypothetical protein n=1 Tax=Streptomyces griseus TaxID=1911 RepID=UPI0009A0BB38|nr:hypothetical protein [Streptomyces griseus]